MGRIACILVSDFSIAALVRANPTLEGAVLAIADSTAAHAELSVLSLRARERGIRPAMTLAQARAISSDLIIRARSQAAEHSAAAALADAAESISPAVEVGAPGCVWLDLAGLGRIYSSEEEVAAELQRRVRRLGMEAAVGVAANREIAALAARCGGIRVIAPGLEREFLDWLPLDVLKLGPTESGLDLELTLARWGLKRLGDLARLDPDAVGSRLGRRGVELVRLARGGDSRPIQPRQRTETFTESIELEYGIETLEPLGFMMRAMLDRLTARLALRGLVAGDIILALGIGGHRNLSRRIAVAAPSNDARAMLTLINLSLEAAPPEAAVESIRIDLEPRAPRPAQNDMFLPPAPAPDRLETTIARLAALCGPASVGTLMPENSHRPEAVRLERFAPPPPPPVNPDAPEHAVAQLVIRAVRPAVEIEVMCSRGGPEFVRGPNLGARVVSIAGPWRRDGEWWQQIDPDAAGTSAQCPPDNNRHRLDQHELQIVNGHPRRQTALALTISGKESETSDAGIEEALARRVRGPGEGIGWPGLSRDERYADASSLMPESPPLVAVRDIRFLNRSPYAAKKTPDAQTPREGAHQPKSQLREGTSARRGFVRDYYELALDDGGVYRIFRDLNSDQWFVDGVYD
ncbi:MAG TPA: DNA polymerase Y family protein [Candidatus Binataceae bacterium]